MADLKFLALAIAGGLMGSMVSYWLMDQIGPKATTAIFGIGTIIVFIAIVI